MVICLERGADLHIAKPMPLPLTVSCSGKIQIGFIFVVPAHLDSPGQKAIKQSCVGGFFGVFWFCIVLDTNACCCVCRRCGLVCMLNTLVSPAETAEPIKMLFWIVDLREPCVR